MWFNIHKNAYGSTKRLADYNIRLNFTDAEFGRDIAMENNDNSSYLWKSVQDTYPNYTIWGDGGLVWNSLNQGYLGDCYFLASCELLANKGILKNSFLNTPLNA